MPADGRQRPSVADLYLFQFDKRMITQSGFFTAALEWILRCGLQQRGLWFQLDYKLKSGRTLMVRCSCIHPVLFLLLL